MDHTELPRPALLFDPITSRCVARSAVSTANNTVSWLVVSAFAACILEGAARKWLLPAGSLGKYAAYFSKDALLVAGLFYPIAFKQPRQESLSQLVYSGAALVFLGGLIASFQSFNPVGAILTLRSMIVLPMAAVLLVPRIPPQTLSRLIAIVLILTVVNAVLGTVQFYSPQGSIINRYASDEEMFVATAGFGERIRATGTFSYITGYGVFSSLALCLGLIALSTGVDRKSQIIGYTILTGAVVCAATTVSRGSAFAILGILSGWALFSGGRAKALVGFAFLAAIAFITLDAFGMVGGVYEVLGATAERHQVTNDSVGGRLATPFLEVPQAISIAPLGHGLGTEQSAGNYFARGQSSFTTFESDWPRIVMEVGVLGFLGVALSYLGAVVEVSLLWRSTRNRRAKAMYVAVGLTLAIWCFGVIFNHVSSFMFWGLFAVVMAASNRPSAGDPAHAPR